MEEELDGKLVVVSRQVGAVEGGGDGRLVG